MTASLGAWLAMREAVDARSRSASLTALLTEHLSDQRPLRALDLATGTGPISGTCRRAFRIRISGERSIVMRRCWRMFHQMSMCVARNWAASTIPRCLPDTILLRHRRSSISCRPSG